MQKFVIKETPDGVFLNYKLDKSQQLNIREIELFNFKKPEFVFPFTCNQTKNDRLFGFNITKKITLIQYLKAITNKQKFIEVVSSFIKMAKECDENKLFLKNVLFDFNYIFVNRITKQIYFIYMPIIDFKNSISLANAFLEIAYSSVFGRMENTDYVSKYIKYLKNSERFSLVKFEEFVKELSNGLYGPVKTMSGPLEPQLTRSTGSVKCSACGTIHSEDGKFCPKCGQVALIRKNSNEAKKQIDKEFIPSIDPLTKVESAQIHMKNENEDNLNGTTVLGEDDAYETSVLSTEETPTVYAYLIRVKSGEKIPVNKPVFRIGKEKSYVDYFISDNGAVSRSHADIITKNGECFIMDHNSTNKTYLSGEIIKPNVEIKIKNGIRISLANEEFIFNTKQEG